MKRGLALAVAAIFGASILGPLQARALPEPGLAAGGGQEAWADWVILTSKKAGLLYFVDVFRDVTPEGLVTTAYVGKGHCSVSRTKHLTVIFCGASGRGYRVSFDEFQMDPLLRSATLRFKHGGFVQRAYWKAKGDPDVGAVTLADGGPWGAEGGAVGGAFQWAPAKARLFGKKLHPGGLSFSFLTTQAGAVAWAGPGITQTFDANGRLHVTKRIHREISR